MIQLFDLVFGLAADQDAQPLVHLGVLLGDDHREVGLAAPQFAGVRVCKVFFFFF